MTKRRNYIRVLAAVIIMVGLLYFVSSLELVTNKPAMQTLKVLGEPGITTRVWVQFILSIVAVVAGLTMLLLTFKQARKNKL